MPAYRTHVRFNLFLALPLLCYGLSNNLSDAAFFGLGFTYSTFFLHPDMDLARQIKLFSIKGLLTLPFRPYSYLFHHRGISHWPIIGTLTRLLWAALLLWLLCDWAGQPFPGLQSIHVNWLFLGIAVADLTHEALDWLEKMTQ